MKHIEILTYNIHKGFSPGKLTFQLPKMKKGIDAINADLIFLQEVSGEHRRRGELSPISQFEFLAHECWPHYAYAKNAVYDKGHHGNAILCKYPFVDWENVDVSKMARASRSVLHGRIQLPGTSTPLHAICIHFGLFKSERESQLKRLCDHIKTFVPDDEPLIIAGDFNDWRMAAVHHLEKVLALREVFFDLKGHYAKTFPALHPTLSIDRIYFRGLTLEDGLCLDAKPWRLLSDHLPLYARFSLR